jgi:hypothetical protein
MVKKMIGGSFLFLFFLLIFAPKQEIYFKIEKELQKEGIVISNEKFSYNLWGLSIEDADIFLKGAKIAKVKSLNLSIFFLYNELIIEDIIIDRGAHKILPKNLDHATAIFSILKPYKIAIDANGSFGKISGGIYLNMNKIFLRVIDKKDIRTFKGFLKKDDKGLYYEKFFN